VGLLGKERGIPGKEGKIITSFVAEKQRDFAIGLDELIVAFLTG